MSVSTIKCTNIMFTNIRKVCTKYGAYIKTSLYVTIFGCSGVDYDGQMECVVMVLCYENNPGSTWKALCFINFFSHY